MNSLAKKHLIPSLEITHVNVNFAIAIKWKSLTGKAIPPGLRQLYLPLADHQKLVRFHLMNNPK